MPEARPCRVSHQVRRPYGPPGHRRQRYRCVPANGDAPHRFTEALPREESWHGDCDVCERPVELRDGPQAARQYQFVARGIAGALKSVGAGASYMRASRISRERASRLRIDPDTFPNASAANWSTFLGRLGGQPPRVVCDNHSGMTNAVRSRWPTTDLYLCEWHLRHALERLLTAQARRGYASAVTSLHPRVEAAFVGLSFWRPFVADCRAAGVPALDNWLNAMNPVIQSQFARRGFASTRPRNMPLTTGGLEQRLRPIRDAIHPRRYALKNRERTNRLLMRMQLHANGDDSEVAYRKAIRLWLEANSGRPRGLRRSITDPLGAPSLR